LQTESATVSADNRVGHHPRLRNNLYATARDLGPIRLRKASTLTRLIGRRTASWPQWDFLMMRCRCCFFAESAESRCPVGSSTTGCQRPAFRR
jgi:hypothetical protein